MSSVSSFGIPFQILTASFPYLKLVILCTWYGSFVCPDSTYTQRHGKEHTWWHHQMETFSALLALCEGNPPYKGSDAELWCILWSVLEQTVEKTIERPVIWNVIALIRTSIKWQPGSCLNIKTVFPRMGISIIKIRRSRDRLIFILVRRHLYIETGPWWSLLGPLYKRAPGGHYWDHYIVTLSYWWSHYCSLEDRCQ